MKNEHKLGKKPETEQECQKLADDLITFAKKEHSVDINEFALSRMISPSKFHALCNQSEYFSDAYDIALHMIGIRLRRMMCEGSIDRHVVLALLPLYDPAYKQLVMSLKLKDEHAGATRVITVEVPQFIDSSIESAEAKRMRLEQKKNK